MRDSNEPTTAMIELEPLISRMCDGSITDADRQRLEEILLRDPAARRIYVDFLTVNSALTWKYRTGDSRPSVEQRPDEPGTEPILHSSSSSRSGGAVQEGGQEGVQKGWLRATSTLLAVAVGLLLALAAWNIYEPDQALVEATPLIAEEGRGFVATLRDATGPVWNNDGNAVNVGARIQIGELKVESGDAEVVFDSGAKLLLAGPAELRVVSPLAAHLLRGTLAAHMPPTAVGFELHTPTSKLVDQGTEFGVQVGESGSTQVHVFRGRVDLHYARAGGKSKSNRLKLFDQQARRIDRQGDSGRQIEFSKQPFGRLAGRVAEPIEWSVEQGGNGHFYQLFVEKQPLGWHEAARLAMNRHFRGMPGHLVTLTSQEEDQFVIRRLIEDVTTRGVWIGLTDVLREGHYRWITGETFDFANWATWPDQQPDNFREADWHGGEDYAMYTRYPNKQPWAWNDLSVDSLHENVSAYVVEYEPSVDSLKNRSMALDPIHWPKRAGGNGHYYRVVLALEPCDWDTIKQLAQQSEVLGVPGHLVAMETAAERDFVADQILKVCGIPELMIGLSGSLQQNDLCWVTGEPVAGFQVERSHLPTDEVYGVFRWNPAGNWQSGWEISAMSTDVLPAGWFGYLIEYPVNEESNVNDELAEVEA